MSLEEFCTLQGHVDRAWHVAWRYDGKMLASCSGDTTVRIWTPSLISPQKQWECIAILEDTQSRTVRACEWSPDGRYLATVSFDATTVIWEKQGNTFEVISSLEGHESEVKSVSWSPSGSYIATCSRDKSIWIWENDAEADFECVSVLHGHSQDVKFVKWHPTKDILFSASYDDTIKVWDENEDDWYCKETLTGHASTVWGIATEPSGDRLASVGDDATLIIWKHSPDSKDLRSDGSSMEWKQSTTLAGFHSRTIFSVDWAKQGTYIATGAADDAIRIFQGEKANFHEVTRQDKAHSSDVNCVRWCPTTLDDGKALILASAGDDTFIKLWKYTPIEN